MEMYYDLGAIRLLSIKETATRGENKWGRNVKPKFRRRLKNKRRLTDSNRRHRRTVQTSGRENVNRTETRSIRSSDDGRIRSLLLRQNTILPAGLCRRPDTRWRRDPDGATIGLGRVVVVAARENEREPLTRSRRKSDENTWHAPEYSRFPHNTSSPGTLLRPSVFTACARDPTDGGGIKRAHAERSTVIFTTKYPSGWWRGVAKSVLNLTCLSVFFVQPTTRIRRILCFDDRTRCVLLCYVTEYRRRAFHSVLTETRVRIVTLVAWLGREPFEEEKLKRASFYRQPKKRPP